MGEIKFSILLPVYNGAAYIAETLRSLLSQSFGNYELIIVDDHSGDATADAVGSFKDGRISFFRNPANLGYPGNLNECLKRASGDIVYLMGQDDILGIDALENTRRAFSLSEDIGAVTRPYFWFDARVDVPVRAKKQLNPCRDEVVTIRDDCTRIIRVFETLDQLSGLAVRRSFMDRPFHKDIFPCHVYPFASVFKKHPVVFLREYTVAVRIRSSQCRLVSSIYDTSPVQSWVDLFETVFPGPEFRILRERMIRDFVAVNYVGLVQIRNYARYAYVWREIRLLLKYRRKNYFNALFWFFSIGCLLMPPFLLIPLVDWYKNTLNSRRFGGIKFEMP